MKASSESGECASLISTVCSLGFRVAVRADMEVRLPFASAEPLTTETPLPKQPSETQEEGATQGTCVAQCRVFSLRKKSNTGAIERARGGNSTPETEAPLRRLNREQRSPPRGGGSGGPRMDSGLDL